MHWEWLLYIDIKTTSSGNSGQFHWAKSNTLIEDNWEKVSFKFQSSKNYECATLYKKSSSNFELEESDCNKDYYFLCQKACKYAKSESIIQWFSI